jgi:hypothetical protein
MAIERVRAVAGYPGLPGRERFVPGPIRRFPGVFPAFSRRFPFDEPR